MLVIADQYVSCGDTGAPESEFDVQYEFIDSMHSVELIEELCKLVKREGERKASEILRNINIQAEPIITAQ